MQRQKRCCSSVPCHSHQRSILPDERALERKGGLAQPVEKKKVTLQCQVVFLETLVSLRSSQECLHVARIEL